MREVMAGAYELSRSVNADFAETGVLPYVRTHMCSREDLSLTDLISSNRADRLYKYRAQRAQRTLLIRLS